MRANDLVSHRGSVSNYWWMAQNASISIVWVNHEWYRIVLGTCAELSVLWRRVSDWRDANPAKDCVGGEGAMYCHGGVIWCKSIRRRANFIAGSIYDASSWVPLEVQSSPSDLHRASVVTAMVERCLTRQSVVRGLISTCAEWDDSGWSRGMKAPEVISPRDTMFNVNIV